MFEPSATRRRLLDGLAVATIGTLAGCSTSTDAESTDSSAAADESTTGEPTNGTSEKEPNRSGPTEGSESTELDLREANVVGVAATAGESGTEFAVELRHDDAGEDGYADWWQVEQRDGTQLGRRDLRHSHPNEQPFERSETIAVPSDVDCVVVRGHDQTHGYGGQVMLLALESGATRTVDQGSEPDSFEGVDCP